MDYLSVIRGKLDKFIRMFTYVAGHIIDYRVTAILKMPKKLQVG